MLEFLGPYGEGTIFAILFAYTPIFVYSFLAAKERMLFMCTGLFRPYDEWFP